MVQDIRDYSRFFVILLIINTIQLLLHSTVINHLFYKITILNCLPYLMTYIFACALSLQHSKPKFYQYILLSYDYKTFSSYNVNCKNSKKKKGSSKITGTIYACVRMSDVFINKAVKLTFIISKHRFYEDNEVCINELNNSRS